MDSFLQKIYNFKIKFLAVSILLLGSTSAFATSLQSFYENASSLGNVYAGASALAEDASTVFYNPAGLTYLPKSQFVFSFVGQDIQEKFDGTTTVKIPTTVTQTGAATSNDFVPWPSLYYAQPLTSRIVVGAGVTMPFGIGTSFSTDSIMQYITTTSSIIVADITPAIGVKATDKISFGAGLDIERMMTETQFFVPSTPSDTQTINKANDWAYGYHLGTLFQILPTTRIGLTYHSQVSFHPKGSSRSITNPGDLISSEFVVNSYNFRIRTPPSTSLSIIHEIDKQWMALAGIDYTQWDVLTSIKSQNVAVGPSTSAIVNNTIPMNYHNTIRYNLGARYKVNPKWLLKAGVAFDPDPTNSTDRIAEIPGANTWILGAGARYTYNKRINFDFGYNYFIYHSPQVNFVGTTYNEQGQLTMGQSTFGLQVSVVTA